MDPSPVPDSKFENRLERSLPRLRRYLQGRAGKALLLRENFSDLVQTICHSLLKRKRHWRGASGDRGFNAWLMRIADQKLADRGRQHASMRHGSLGPIEELEGREAVEKQDPLWRAQLSEDLERLDRALEEMDSSHRDLVIRLRMRGEAPRHVAVSLGISEATLRVRLHRALARLSVLVNQR